ncbi:MAG TPA: hypothetical protein VF683_03555 [Chthoniobacterales bacterium]
MKGEARFHLDENMNTSAGPLLAAIVMLAAAAVAQAATITVNTTTDPAGFNANITIAQLGATVTLRDAVNAANNTAGNDEIVFAPALGSGADSHVTPLNITSTVTLRGLPTGVTIARLLCEGMSLSMETQRSSPLGACNQCQFSPGALTHLSSVAIRPLLPL